MCKFCTIEDIEVYSITGQFIFSEDTEEQAYKEIARNFIESIR